MERGFLSTPLMETLEPRTLLSVDPVLVADLVIGAGGSNPSNFVNVNGTLFFNANDGVNGIELWRSNGTAAGTKLVKDILTGSGGSYPGFLTNVNGTLFFSANDGVNGHELWRSDGTSAGTTLVKDIVSGSSNSLPLSLANVNGTLFFSALSHATGAELWKSDGTAGGTTIVKDIRSGSGGSQPRYLTNVNGTLFFSADDVRGRELWRSDGTEAGTTSVRDIRSFQDFSSSPTFLTNVNGTLFFRANDGTSGTELWKSDGTSAGTTLIKDIRTGVDQNGRPRASDPELFTNVNGTLFFSAFDDVNGRELWQSDGTSVGTTLVKDIRSGSENSIPTSLTNVNGTLFFSSNSNFNGVELWKSDGTSTGTTLVKDIRSGSGSSNPRYLTNVNGTLFFRAVDDANGYELWQSDGTSAGTKLVKDIRSGGSTYPSSMTTVNGTLFFSANDGVRGRELWSMPVQNKIGLVGTSGANAFVLTYSSRSTSGNVTVTVSTNGGPVLNLGTYPMNSPLTIDGRGGADSVRVVGTAGADKYLISSSGRLTTNGAGLVLESVETTTLAGVAGDDFYQFDADTALGVYTLDEAGGEIDTVDLSLTTTSGVAVNLGTTTQQVVNSNLSLKLSSSTVFEKAIGGSGNDTLSGNSLANTLTGNAGNDTLTGGSGDDSLVGGLGDDTYLFGAATTAEADTVTEGTSAGTDRLSFSSLATDVILGLETSLVQAVHANRTLKLNAASVLEEIVGGSGNDTLSGNSLANTLTGNAGNDKLTGGGGDDSLVGGLGDDIYVFGTATTVESDTVAEATSAGTDTLSFSTLATDVILGLETSLVQTVHANRTLKLNAASVFENIVGGSGNDTLSGNALGNTLTGNAGNDKLTGGGGNDSLVGGLGDDTYVFAIATTAEADTVTEGTSAGTDKLSFSSLTTDVMLSLETSIVQTVHANRTLKLNAGTVFENMNGGSGNDTLTGNLLGNILVGNAGDDNLTGGGGRDILIGSLGLDTLNGGEDEDILIAGRTTSDALSSNLNRLLVEWVSLTSYATRISNLRAGVGSPVVSLKAKVNVLNDAGDDDSLIGGNGTDWYFRALDDVIIGLARGEITDVL